MELRASGTINGGSFTGGHADIYASTIGLNTPPTPNVSSIYISLSSQVGSWSGKLNKGSLTTRPPDENVLGPASKKIGPWSYLATEEGIEGTITGATSFASYQQEAIESLLASITDVNFFMTPPLEIYIDMEEEVEEGEEDDETALLLRPGFNKPTLLYENYNWMDIPGISYYQDWKSKKDSLHG